MARDFLYCEETDTKIYSNDVVSISTYPDTKWIAKQGWYIVGSARKHGWYFISPVDKTIISIDLVDIKDIIKDTNRGTSETRPSIPDTPVPQDEPTVEYLHCEATDTLIYPNDLVELSGIKYVAKYGWYTFNDEQKRGWYFLSVEGRDVSPVEFINLDTVTKIVETGTSEFRPTLLDMDSTPPELNYIVIPGTNIRLYDSDIVKISGKPGIKWVVHSGWFIYQNVQNFGWYFESIKNGEILPVSIVDLTLVSLVTTKTQGSEKYDGKVVNYTRPFTEYDAEILDRTFITVETIEQRNNLDSRRLVNGRIVRVNNVGGVAVYYAYDEANKDWIKIEEGGSGGGIPEVIGTLENPIVLSRLEKGLYRVKGIYLICPTSDQPVNADIDQLVFVSGETDTSIKIITNNSITDYIVVRDYVTFTNEYATVLYVNGQIATVEMQISEIISELSGFIKKSVESGATFNKGQWAIFDNSSALKGQDATASNVAYVPPPSGPTSTVSNVQNAIDILNARLDGAILYDTEENWNAQPQLISAKGSIYVYSNHEIFQGKLIPGIKIGDGVTYLIDMAFLDDPYANHIRDTIIHVSTEDREFWGDKVTCNIDPMQMNTLIFTKE